MPNGRPGDHPLTDLLKHGHHPFPAEVEELILELQQLNPTALANTEDMLADWQQGTQRGITWLKEKLIESK